MCRRPGLRAEDARTGRLSHARLPTRMDKFRKILLQVSSCSLSIYYLIFLTLKKEEKKKSVLRKFEPWVHAGKRENLILAVVFNRTP